MTGMFTGDRDRGKEMKRLEREIETLQQKLEKIERLSA